MDELPAMAILKSLPGLEVTIRVDGKPLQEYDDDEEEEAEVEETPVAEYQAAKTVSKYVEVASDKEFLISITLWTSFKMDFEALMAPIKIDGKHVIEVAISKQDNAENIRGSRILHPLGLETKGASVPAPGNKGRELLRKFKFERIETSKLLPRPAALLVS